MKHSALLALSLSGVFVFLCLSGPQTVSGHNGPVSDTSDNSAHWLFDDGIGENSSVKAISSPSPYAAPTAVPSRSVIVSAQSIAQSGASAAGIRALMSVSISPSSARVQTNRSQQFMATVSGTSNARVNWLVNGVLGGNSTVGTISSSGLYTAPAAVPTAAITVTAQNAAGLRASGGAAVSVKPLVSVTISPSTADVPPRRTQQFNAWVSGTGNTSVKWLVSGVVGGNSSVGTISSTGLYTAPASMPTGPVTVTARSTYQPSSSASVGVIVSKAARNYVNLSWTASTFSVAGYNIYRSTQSTGPFTKINSSIDTEAVYTDNTVRSGQTYYYVTTAVSENGVESSYSNLTQAIVP